MDKIISIYGAQLMAGTIYEALKRVRGIKVNYFIVSERQGNPNTIDSIEVITLEEYTQKNMEEQILIAVPEEHHSIIGKQLDHYHINNYIYLTSRLRNQILEEYYKEHDDFATFKQLTTSYSTSDEASVNYGRNSANDIGYGNNLQVFMARSSKDRVLNYIPKLPEWIISIQAGAILDRSRLLPLSDDTGDNISNKNPDYCELTVLYWVWKNKINDYIGLCHYRRIFDIQDKDISELMNIKPDVILPYPTIHFPNIQSQYVRYITREEWNILREAILINSPELRESWDVIWDDRYFYNYNMLIASKEVMNRYCEWLFTILSIVEKLCMERKIANSKRYAGYMGEILLTIYFRFYCKNLKIVHVGVTQLV